MPSAEALAWSKALFAALGEALLTVHFWESEWKKRITVSDSKLA